MLDKKYVSINLPFELVLGSSGVTWTFGSGTGTWDGIGAGLGAGIVAAALP